MYNYYLIIVFVAILLIVISMYFIWQKQLEMEFSISSIRNLRSSNSNANPTVSSTVTGNSLVANATTGATTNTISTSKATTSSTNQIAEDKEIAAINKFDSPDIIQDIVEKELSFLNNVPLSSKIVVTSINPFAKRTDIESNVVEEINSLDEVIIQNDDDNFSGDNEEYENLDLIQNLLHSSRSEFATSSDAIVNEMIDTIDTVDLTENSTIHEIDESVDVDPTPSEEQLVEQNIEQNIEQHIEQTPQGNQTEMTLKNSTVSELKSLCTKYGLKPNKKSTKKDLIDTLMKSEYATSI